MKRFLQFFSFIAIGLVFSAFSAQAQSVTKVQADVPFAFTIGDKTFEAGKYDLKVINNASGSVRVQLTDEDGKVMHSAVMLRNGSGISEKAELVFDVNGADRVLSSIKTDDAGYTLPKFKKSKSVTIRASVPLTRAEERN